MTSVNLDKYVLNYTFERKDARDKLLKEHLTTPVNPSELPPSVDLRPNWGSIYDQGNLGSCVSNSVSYCVRYTLVKEGETPFIPSRLFIYYNGRVNIEKSPASEDTGLDVRDGYKSVASYSVCGENNWPYDVSKFALKPNQTAYTAAGQHKTFKYLSVDQNLNLLKKCLKDGYPISFGFTVYDSFMTTEVATTGIVPVPDTTKEQQQGGHCVSIVGYDDSKKTFIVANSWSADWGDKGFCYFPYSMICDPNICGDFWTPRVFK